MVGAYTYRNLHGDCHAHVSLRFVLVELAIVDRAIDEFELNIFALLLSHDQEIVVEDVGS